jgi:Ca2+-binding EF-hand superfamily protein
MITSILGRLTALFGWTTFTITFEPDDDVPGQSFDVINLCLKLGYSRRDIDVMYTNFKKLDVNNKNVVLFASFCQENFIDNPLGELLFQKILALGEKNEIDFQNYLVCIWNALSIFDNSNMAELVFQLFDSDNSGKKPVRSFFSFSIFVDTVV